MFIKKGTKFPSLSKLCVEKCTKDMTMNIRGGNVTMNDITAYYLIYYKQHLHEYIYKKIEWKKNVFEYIYNCIKSNNRYYAKSFSNLVQIIDTYNKELTEDTICDFLYELYQDHSIDVEKYEWFESKKYIEELEIKEITKTRELFMIHYDNYVELFTPHSITNEDIHKLYYGFYLVTHCECIKVYNNIVFLSYLLFEENNHDPCPLARTASRDPFFIVMNQIKTKVSKELIVDIASANGYISTLEWFVEYHKELPYTTNAIDLASANGRKDILEWWKNSKLELKYTCDSIDKASMNGYTHVLDWWKNSELELKYTFDAMNKTKSKYILDWWFKSDLELKFDVTAIYNSIKTSNLTLMHWWINNEKIIKRKAMGNLSICLQKEFRHNKTAMYLYHLY